MQPTVLAQVYSTYADIKPGQNVKGTIVSMINQGLVIAITDTIKGFIPKLHMSDVVLSDPAKMFKIGSSIKCQVYHLSYSGLEC